MNDLDRKQIDFYTRRFKDYGDDVRSVYWRSEEVQLLRFKKIAELFKYEKRNFSVHEVGCGISHFNSFLRDRGYSFSYSGSDIVTEFIEKSRQKYSESSFFIESISIDYEEISKEIKWKDFYCLNGTFNPITDISVKEWEGFVFKSLTNMFKMAKKGIVFNMLTSYAEYYEKGLYYADPKVIFDWCVKNLSRFVTISQDTPFFDFFVYVYKDEYIKDKFPSQKKYF